SEAEGHTIKRPNVRSASALERVILVSPSASPSPWEATGYLGLIQSRSRLSGPLAVDVRVACSRPQPQTRVLELTVRSRLQRAFRAKWPRDWEPDIATVLGNSNFIMR